MLRIILAGCHGRMGREVVHCCADRSEVCISAGLDRTGRTGNEFPVYSEFSRCGVPADVLVDFSQATALNQILTFCMGRKLPVVLAVTGYSQHQLDQIKAASRYIPIFRSANLSVGAYALQAAARKVAKTLGGEFDVTIVERHHKGKIDSPSGTALMLAKSIPKKSNTISIRAGNTTAGEHTVLFTGQNEGLELTHRADSREVYAAGAIRAARFIAKINRPGLYGMENLLK